MVFEKAKVLRAAEKFLSQGKINAEGGGAEGRGESFRAITGWARATRGIAGQRPAAHPDDSLGVSLRPPRSQR